MKISGMEKLTLLDYPDKLACIIFTTGCNFRCPFCQNSELLKITHDEGLINEEDIFDYLNKRKNILDGVVISGGEPTLQPNLIKFIEKVKSLGFSVKLDTNGFEPIILENLLDRKLIDYVAMDVKNSLEKYCISTGINNIKTTNILKSIDILKNSDIDYEFRTTIVKEHHTIDDIRAIMEIIGKDNKYYIQNFVNSENVIDKSLHGFTELELKCMLKELNKDYPNVKVRGL